LGISIFYGQIDFCSEFFCSSSYDKRVMTIHTQNNPTQNSASFSGLTSLPQWGLILVSGEDAESFLQNQLTNSVIGLSPTPVSNIAHGHQGTRLVGYCSAKGRLLASAWIASYELPDSLGQCFALFLSKDIAASFAKRLSMFVLRSKVIVKDVSNQWSISGFYGDAKDLSTFTLNPQGFGLRLPEVLIAEDSQSRVLIAQSMENKVDAYSEKDFLRWNSLEVLSAIPRIVLATQEQFVPQMINFESVAGVDFKKGCYPGQEIVARSQYRGAIKRRLQLAHLDGPFDPISCAPGVELFHQDEPTQPAGMVVLSAPNPQKGNWVDFQIECKLETLQLGQIHLGSSEGPVLQIDSLPYPLIEI
jgi:folate-binding protein YgfZ